MKSNKLSFGQRISRYRRRCKRAIPALDAMMEHWLLKHSRHFRFWWLVSVQRSFASPSAYEGRVVQHRDNTQARVCIDSAAHALYVPLGMGAVCIFTTQTQVRWVLPPTPCRDCRIRTKIYPRDAWHDGQAAVLVKRAVQRVDPMGVFHPPIAQNADLALCALAAGPNLAALLDALSGRSSARERLAMVARWPLLAEWEVVDSGCAA